MRQVDKKHDDDFTLQQFCITMKHVHQYSTLCDTPKRLNSLAPYPPLPYDGSTVLLSDLVFQVDADPSLLQQRKNTCIATQPTV